MDTRAPRVLLVDADELMLDAFIDTMRYRLPDIDVDRCSSGQSAVERIRSSVDYHAIVSEFTMPDMSGLTLLAEVKRERPAAPVLFMTGLADQQLVLEAIKRGAYDFIHKPIDREQILLALKRALETYELRLLFVREGAVATQLFQELRQLQQVLRPLLLSSLKTLGRELGSERLEQSRSMLDNALQMCATQNRLIRRRLDSIQQLLEGTERRLESSLSQAQRGRIHYTKAASD